MFTCILFHLAQYPYPPLPVWRTADPALWQNPPGDDLLWPLQVGHQRTQDSSHAGRHEVQIKGDKSCYTSGRYQQGSIIILKIHVV